MGFSISQSLYFGSVLKAFINCYYSNGMKQMFNHSSTSCDHFLDNSSSPVNSCSTVPSKCNAWKIPKSTRPSGETAPYSITNTLHFAKSNFTLSSRLLQSFICIV
ncbi:hypothetical protein ACROYT_G021304 [Oculina patagonica]